MELRGYQHEAHDNVADNFINEAIYRQLGVLPTGCGKTVVFTHLPQQPEIRKWLDTYAPQQQKMLIIAHREELLEQAADKVRRSSPDLIVEIEMADRHASPMADVVVASIQTLAARAGKRMQKFHPENFRIIVVDEAHHVTAPSYISVLQYFGLLPPDSFMEEDYPRGGNKEEQLEAQRVRLATWDLHHKPDRLLLGVTATSKRGDNVGLEAVFQRITFCRNMREMISSKYLTPLRAIRVQSATSLEGVKSRAGDFAQDELAEAVDNVERNRLAVKAWQEHGLNRPFVAFCASVQHAEDMAEQFRQSGIATKAVHGGMTKEDRREVLRQYSNGELMGLTNCQVLTEGWDEPRVRCIIHARPTQSSLLYIQMTGRGTRLMEGKDDCLIIDIVDISRRHQLVTAPELFGLPANFDAQGADLNKLANKVEQMKAENPFAYLGEASSLDEMEMLVESVDLFSMENNAIIKENSTLAWVYTGDEFCLSWPGPDEDREMMFLRQNPLNQWEISLGEGRTAKTVSKPQSSVAMAFKRAEEWIHINRPGVMQMKNQYAAWRSQPSSPGQSSYLSKFMPNMPKAQIGKLTKGQASDMIEYYQTRAHMKANRVRRPAA